MSIRGPPPAKQPASAPKQWGGATKSVIGVSTAKKWPPVQPPTSTTNSSNPTASPTKWSSSASATSISATPKSPAHTATHIKTTSSPASTSANSSNTSPFVSSYARTMTSTTSGPSISHSFSSTASTSIKLPPDAEKQLTLSYQAAKGVPTTGNDPTPIQEKLLFLLASTDERHCGNGIYFTQIFLEQGQGIPFMVSLLKDKNENLVVSACKALTNFVMKENVVKEINQIGFMNIISLLKSSRKDRGAVVKFLCNALNNETTTKLFIQQGGLDAVLEIALVSKEFEENSCAMVVINNIISVIKPENYGLLASDSLLKQMAKVIRQKPDPELTYLVMRLLYNITYDDRTRPQFIKHGLHNDLIVYVQDPHTFRDLRLATMVSRLINNVLKDPHGAKTLGQAGAFEYLAKALTRDDDELQLATLATIANFALNDKAIAELQTSSSTTGEVFKQLMSVLTRSNKHDVKLRCAIALSNLMTVDGVQRTFADVGGVSTLMMVATSKTESEDIKTKALGALFHMSMFSDEIRKKVVEQGTLKSLGEILSGPSKEMKVVAAKTLVNLSLTDENEKSFIDQKIISKLITTMGSSDNPELQTLASMCLENLSFNKDASDNIRECGGIDVAAKLLSSKNLQIQERSAKLMAKLAVNSKNRKEFQDKYGIELLKSTMAACRDSTIKQSIGLALNNMSVPHFEEDSSVSEVDEFEDLRGCGLGDEDDDYRGGSEVERAPDDAFLYEDEDQPIYTPTSNSVFENESERAPSLIEEEEEEERKEEPKKEQPSQPSAAIPKPVPIPPRPKLPPRAPSAPLSSTAPATIAAHNRMASEPAISTAAADEDDEVEEDRGLKKEQYMLAPDAVPAVGRKKNRKALTQLFIKIKNKLASYVGGSEEESVEIKQGPWPVQEELVTNKCAAVLYDYYDQWCEGCKRNGSTCDKEMGELRTLRMSLIRSRAPKSYPPGSSTVASEPYIASSFTPRPRSHSLGDKSSGAAITADTAALPKQPPPKPPPKPAQFRAPPIAGKEAVAPPLPQTPPPPNALKKSAPNLQPRPQMPPAQPPKQQPQPVPPKPQPAPPKQPQTPMPNGARPPQPSESQPPLPKGPPPPTAKRAVAARPPASNNAPAQAPKVLKPIPENVDPEKLERAKLHFRRTKVAQELLETEGTYVKNLAIIIRKFQNPMLSSASTPKPLATELETRTIFSSVEIIYSLNSMLLEGLNNKMRRWSSKQTIGDVFLYLGDFLKSYTDYINNYDNSQMTVLKCKENNPRFAKFLDEMQMDPVCNGLGLQSYLIMPVQRLPRYVLLLTELLKATRPDHTDYQPLTAALSKMQNVAEYVNNKKREFESRFKLLEIAHSLEGNVQEIVQPHRQFIGAAEAAWEIKGHKKGKGKLFIFNDALLICKDKGKIHKIARLILLKTFAAVALGQGSEPTFQIITSDTKDTITLTFSDEYARDAFYSTYTQAPNSINFLVKHPPAGMAENPWADTAPATRGFDPNICKSLLKELEECIDLFSKLYQDIGTRNDTRELRGKLSSLRNKANDAAARLRSQLAEPISQRQAESRKQIAQEANDVLQRLADITKKVAQKEKDVVTVMRESLSSGQSPSEVVKLMKLDNGIQLQELDVTEQLVNERNAAANELTKQAAELAVVARDVANLVEQSAADLQTAEQQVERADENVSTGVTNLQHASDYLCGLRKKIFFIILASVIAAVVIAVVITVAVVTTQSSSSSSSE